MWLPRTRRDGNNIGKSKNSDAFLVCHALMAAVLIGLACLSYFLHVYVQTNTLNPTHTHFLPVFSKLVLIPTIFRLTRCISLLRALDTLFPFQYQPVSDPSKPLPPGGYLLQHAYPPSTPLMPQPPDI